MGRYAFHEDGVPFVWRMIFRKTATRFSGSCFGGIKPLMSVHDRPAVESSDVLLAALERANDAVVILDQDHRITHFNASAERIWGVARAEIRVGPPARSASMTSTKTAEPNSRSHVPTATVCALRCHSRMSDPAE